MLVMYTMATGCLATERGCDSEPLLEFGVIFTEAALFVGVLAFGWALARRGGNEEASEGKSSFTNPMQDVEAETD